MRWFRHIIAEHVCTACAQRRPVIEVTLSPFFFAAAAVAAISWWTVTVTRPSDFPWYDAISIYGAELLGVFLAGLCTTVFAWSDHLGSSVCRACGAPTTFRGRHFDRLGSRRPHWKDLAVWRCSPA